MSENQRQHKRLVKRFTLQFCVVDIVPKKWDMSMIENISVGGVKFTALSELKLKNKIVQLQIRLPELKSRYLELEALVLSVEPRFNGKISDVRAKFINVTEAQKKDLAILENVINLQDNKNDPKKP